MDVPSFNPLTHQYGEEEGDGQSAPLVGEALEPSCKVCGHLASAHRYDEPVRCRHCPQGVCDADAPRD